MTSRLDDSWVIDYNATATLGCIARGNDGGIAAVIARVIASALPFSCQQ